MTISQGPARRRVFWGVNGLRVPIGLSRFCHLDRAAASPGGDFAAPSGKSADRQAQWIILFCCTVLAQTGKHIPVFEIVFTLLQYPATKAKAMIYMVICNYRSMHQERACGCGTPNRCERV
ncbi:hypothetical protein HNQ50_004078 [Silvimonas terrae]|uniref:Uncharacterized protein n=1 Tax=Silvimonas terrae TaxID=300266 RepID=A0A840RL57_9NEIS|nr:hypothetical protein [Silvimonas terrae]MBB5193324.1 hypothetical protein [Silvimonas terrae]